MSRFLTNNLRRSATRLVAVSSHGAVWVDAASDPRSWSRIIMWEEGSNPTIAMQLLRIKMKLTADSELAWVVAPSLLRHWLQAPPANTQSLHELHAVAQARAVQLFGASMPTEVSLISTWDVAGDWHAAQAFMCGAMPSIWRLALQNRANTNNQICSPLQLALRSFKHQLPASGWLALVIADTLHLMFFENKQIQNLRCLALSSKLATTDLQSLALTEWRREMLRSNKLSDQLQYLNLTSQDHSNLTMPAGLKRVKWTPKLMGIDEAIQESTPSAVGIHELEQTLWCALQCAGHAYV